MSRRFRIHFSTTNNVTEVNLSPNNTWEYYRNWIFTTEPHCVAFVEINEHNVPISIPEYRSAWLGQQEDIINNNVLQPPAHNDQPESVEAPVNIESKERMKKSQSKEKSYNIELFDYLNHYFWENRRSRTKGEIGLEIECEGENLFQAPLRIWSVHEDHSLRVYNNHAPLEYVMREPLSRDDTRKALDYLNSSLKSAKSKLVPSHRTSVHVHVNVQDLTIKQLYNYFGLWTILEEPLTKWCGEDRVGNLFCLRSRDAEAVIIAAIEAARSNTYKHLFSEAYRYLGCNIAAVKKFGSLEFRTLRGTVDTDLIMSWVDLLLKLKNIAIQYEDPRKIVEHFQRIGPKQFVEDILKDTPNWVQVIESYPTYYVSLWDGLRLFRDMAYAIKWEPRKDEKLSDLSV